MRTVETFKGHTEKSFYRFILLFFSTGVTKNKNKREEIFLYFFFQVVDTAVCESARKTAERGGDK